MNKITEGIIFDIQRCSMHDGPGIRTTVFLKGCPLSCKWCHNPESQRLNPQLAFYEEKCIGCKACVGECMSNVHQFSENKHIVDFKKCSGCGKCSSVCGNGALKLLGERISAEKIIDIVNRDRAYYDCSGGGLTVTGGEPFYQYEFLKELVRSAKNEKIHVCVETCGFVHTEKLTELLPYIDMFLFDYKETSPELHKKYTGVDNKLILENLQYLYNKGKQIILRCPIIPSYNDNIAHLRGIHELEQKFDKLAGIEIMPYHDLGKGKASAIGNAYEVNTDTLDEKAKCRLKQMLTSCGCGEKIISSF